MVVVLFSIKGRDDVDRYTPGERYTHDLTEMFRSSSAIVPAPAR